MTCRQNAVIQPRSSPTPSAPPRGTAQSHGDVTSGLPVPPEPTIFPVCLQASAHPPIGARELLLDSTPQTGHADSHPDFSAHLQGRARQLVKLRDTVGLRTSRCHCVVPGEAFAFHQHSCQRSCYYSLTKVVLLQHVNCRVPTACQGRVTTACQSCVTTTCQQQCSYSVSTVMLLQHVNSRVPTACQGHVPTAWFPAVTLPRFHV